MVGAVLLAFVPACGSQLLTEEAFDGGAADAEGAPAATVDAGDAGDAADAAACARNPIRGAFDDPGWLVAGDVTKNEDTAVLTPDAPWKRGAVTWRDRHVMDAFEMEADIRIASGSSVGDGLAFAWFDVGAVPVLGDFGGNMGVCSLGGYAVAVDTTPRADAGSPVTIKLIDLHEAPPDCSDAPIAEAPLGAGVIGGFHRLRVVLGAGGAVVAAVDGTVVLDAKIPGYQPFPGTFGFGAATGGASSEQAVRASAIALRNEPSCL